MDPVPVDRYILETLLPDLVGHDRHPSAFLVYLTLWSRSSETRQRTVTSSLAELAEATGLSKRAVQDALGRLVRRRLVAVERESVTSVPRYTVLRPWARRTAR
jgi:DNA-binding MarR family transcriptional regulator